MQARKNAVEKTKATLGGKVHGGGQPGVGSPPVGTGTGHPTGNHPISDSPGNGADQYVVAFALVAREGPTNSLSLMYLYCTCVFCFFLRLCVFPVFKVCFLTY
jgi:hypothetical protein